MEVGIIGAGMIGATLARLLSARATAVVVGTRDPDDPRLADLPPHVTGGTVIDAARFGIATIVAVPFSSWPDLATVLRPCTSGRVILDTSNAIPSRDGAVAQTALASGHGSGAAVAALLPMARIVKAFSAIHFATLAARAGAIPPLGIPLAGDDPAAVAIAASVVAAAGFAPVPAGALRASGKFDFGTPLFNTPLSETELRRALQLNN